MRRCPFCHVYAPDLAPACDYCGARLTALDAHRTWRALRRAVRRLRRARAPRLAPAIKLLLAGLFALAAGLELAAIMAALEAGRHLAALLEGAPAPGPALGAALEAAGAADRARAARLDILMAAWPAGLTLRFTLLALGAALALLPVGGLLEEAAAPSWGPARRGRRAAPRLVAAAAGLLLLLLVRDSS